MPPTATLGPDLDLIAPGSRVIVRDLEWQVLEIERQAMGTRAIVRCVGRSELVRDQPASFYSDIDTIEPEDPTRTTFRVDTSANGIETRLVLESLVRRTPLPISHTALSVGHKMLVDELPYQREPFRAAMAQLQPRLLVADSVGLGKTIEVGMLLAELQRRGRANRVLVVVPRHILDQVQHELWCRAGVPLVRLDSDGIQRLRQKIPAGRNPFAYFNRVIVSIDTIKSASRYRHHLEKVRWDVVWIDESHKLVNQGTLNNQLAHVLAPNADALILSSATPHNGKPESFAELISLLDPTAVADPDQVTAGDIEHLVVRRHKHSPDVEAVIGDRWAERAEPTPITVVPTAEEEALFAELSSTWVGPETKAPCSDPLFAWTLLKAALSSPAALAESIENRLARRSSSALETPNRPVSDAEDEALRRLWVLAQAAMVAGSAKVAELVSVLKNIGVGKRKPVRAVVFSERIRTLDWIAEAIRTELGMSADQVQTFHNSKSEDEQQRVIEDFSMASAKIRVLVTSDIAAEGVNLHHQCHHMVHVDLPWSLITLEQRNGRIDRYGQLHSPEIRYLVYQPADAEVASDMRIVSRLIEKENAAHRALGDASSVMGLHSEGAEEQAIVAALRRRTREDREAALEAAAPDIDAFDPWAFAGLSSADGTGDGETSAAIMPPTVLVEPAPSLFEGDDDFLRRSVDHLLTLDPSPIGSRAKLSWEEDDTVLSFRPPDDLMDRLKGLPQSYLRQRNLAERLRLTADTEAANRSLEDAVGQRAASGDTGTAWPEIHHLGPQHPVLEWVADKLLYRVARNEALALACAVREPALLVSGVWSNKLGEPIAAAWSAATVEDGLVTFEDLHAALAEAGVRHRMVAPAWDGDPQDLQALVPTVVRAMQARLADDLRQPLEDVTNRLEQTRRRLEGWQSEARRIATGIKSEAHRRRRLDDVELVSRQIEGLIADNTPADAPLIRVVGALVPSSTGGG
ncbi:DEAD/DEAH box helicase [Patulibacter sp. NPDC049589]|uniref:DEAD/DEAH box helicase n=1 Tax=Patulibacter sp. NPDC049589 TaxID=3154731 RepID=UPI0034178C82